MTIALNRPACEIVDAAHQAQAALSKAHASVLGSRAPAALKSELFVAQAISKRITAALGELAARARALQEA